MFYAFYAFDASQDIIGYPKNNSRIFQKGSRLPETKKGLHSPRIIWIIYTIFKYSNYWGNWGKGA